VGVVLVTTDKGLCGGLNTNISRLVLARIKEFEQQGVRVQATALGSKGLGLLNRVGVNVVSSEVQLGDAPNLERLIGAIKVQLDDFVDGKVGAVYLATTLPPTKSSSRAEAHTSALQSREGRVGRLAPACT